jgi:hypothetical protein
LIELGIQHAPEMPLNPCQAIRYPQSEWSSSAAAGISKFAIASSSILFANGRSRRGDRAPCSSLPAPNNHSQITDNRKRFPLSHF